MKEELIDNGPFINTLLLQKNIVAPLSEKHLKNACFEYLGRFEEQSYSRKDFSTLTYRIMHNFRLIVSTEIEEKIIGQPYIRKLSLREVQNNLTRDNIPIKDNIIEITRCIKE